jgi:HKD family nuclease
MNSLNRRTLVKRASSGSGKDRLGSNEKATPCRNISALSLPTLNCSSPRPPRWYAYSSPNVDCGLKMDAPAKRESPLSSFLSSCKPPIRCPRAPASISAMMDCNDIDDSSCPGLAYVSFANGGVLTTPNTTLLQESQLLDRLILRLSKSESVDVAIAWIRRGKALDALLDFAKAHPQRVRILCGVNGYLTEPQALSAIRSCCVLKIAYGTSGIKLHSKIFIFREGSSTRLWVGSANLTESAFSTNREVVAEVEDYGEGIALFERYWAEFDKPDDVWMDDYASAYALVASKPPAYPLQVGPPRKSQLIAPAWSPPLL